MTTQKKMIRLNRTDTFKVMQWMSSNREVLERQSASEGIKMLKEAGFLVMSESMYNRIRQDLGWKSNQQKIENDLLFRLIELEAQVANLQSLIDSQPWTDPRLL
jgi:hypothetical protein